MFTVFRNISLAPVTVIVPCFRCAKVIGRAVDSIMNQTLIPKQIILIDDASDDDTLNVLYQIKRRYIDIISVITLEKNCGPSAARNIGWDLATQPYIAFLDADDSWHPKKIEIQYDYMCTHPSVVLSGHGFKKLSENDNFPDWKLNRWNTTAISKESLLLSNRFITPSVMLRSDIKRRFNPYQRHMEDHMLWLDIVFDGGKAIKISAALAAIHKHSFGASGLSSQLFKMEKGDLTNYRRLYRTGRIIWLLWFALSILSLVKFIRRIIVVFSMDLLSTVRFKQRTNPHLM